MVRAGVVLFWSGASEREKAWSCNFGRSRQVEERRTCARSSQLQRGREASAGDGEEVCGVDVGRSSRVRAGTKRRGWESTAGATAWAGAWRLSKFDVFCHHCCSPRAPAAPQHNSVCHSAQLLPAGFVCEIQHGQSCRDARVKLQGRKGYNHVAARPESLTLRRRGSKRRLWEANSLALSQFVPFENG